MIAAKDINTSKVTLEQIARCQRVIDETTGKPFYMVESESDPTAEYKVTWTKKHGFACTCPAGQEGFVHCYKFGVCKHVVWSVAAARADRPFEVHNRHEHKGVVSYTLKRGNEYQVVMLHKDGVYTCDCVAELDELALTSDCEHCKAAQREEELFHSEMKEHARYVAGN